MPSANNAFKTFLLNSGATTAHIVTMQKEVLEAAGYTSGSLVERWLDFLSDQGYSTGTINDRWMGYLGSLGYTGHLQDRLYDYWINETLSGLLSLEDIYANLLNNGDGLILDWNTDTVHVKDSGTPANDIEAGRIADFLTINNTKKQIIHADGLMKWQKHNQYLHSEDLTQANWAKAAVTAASVDRLVVSSSSGQHGVSQTSTVASGLHRVSVKAKSNGYDYIWFNTAGAGGITGGNDIVFFNIATGSVGTTQANCDASVSGPDNDGFYTCSCEWTAPFAGGAASIAINIAESDGQTGNWSGDDASGVFLKEMHFHAFPADKTYVRTTTAARYGLPYSHDPLTLDTSSSTVSIALGQATFVTGNSIEWRKHTTAWADSTAYSIGDGVQVDNRSYTCIVAHTSDNDAPSGEGDSQWKRDEKYIRSSATSDVDGAAMWGRVDTFDGTDQLVVDVLRVVGSGSYDDWHLIEPMLCEEAEQRINLTTKSNSLTTWVVQAGDSLTVTASSAVGPDGQNSLSKIEVTDTSNEQHNIYDGSAVSTDTYYAFSAFVRNGDQRYISLRVFRSTNNWSTVIYDLQTGTVTQESTGGSSGTILDSNIEDWGNGLFRIWMVSKENGTTAYFAFNTVSSGTPTLDSASGADVYAGTAGEYFFGGFVDFEAGQTISSHKPTAGTTATRAPDNFYVETADFPVDSVLTIYSDLAPKYSISNAQVAWSLNNNTGNDIIIHRPSDNFHLQVATAGVNQCTLDAGTYTVGQFSRFATRVAANDFAACLNGGNVVADNSGTVPPISELQIGAGANGVSPANINARMFVIMPTGETNAQLQARAA